MGRMVLDLLETEPELGGWCCRFMCLSQKGDHKAGSLRNVIILVVCLKGPI